MTKDTFDAYMWATLEAKQRFISQVMTSRSPARSCEDMDEQALSYAEVKSLATGDPRIKERMDLEMEISKLKLLRASHMNQRFEMQSRLQRIPLEIQSYEQAREKLAADHASYMQNKAGDFSMTICGTRYANEKRPALRFFPPARPRAILPLRRLGHTGASGCCWHMRTCSLPPF